MISLKEWMELVDYRITEGSNYGWQCYGANAYSLDSWDNDQDGASFSIIFDNKTQAVYEVQAHDYKNSRAYRRINSDYLEAYTAEATQRDSWMSQAWDDVEYCDLETDDDWIQKSLAIIAGEDYDTRVQVPVDFDDGELLQYMKMAHDMDITFNEFVERALVKVLEDHKLGEFTRDYPQDLG
jgi:hypothetical protein